MIKRLFRAFVLSLAGIALAFACAGFTSFVVWTLQAVYNAGPSVTLNATSGAVVIQDNNTPISDDLLRVQDSGGSSNRLFYAAGTGTGGGFGSSYPFNYGSGRSIGIFLNNTTPSTAGAPVQNSGFEQWLGHVWNTSTLDDHTMRLRSGVTVAAGNPPTATWLLYSRVDALANFDLLSITTDGSSEPTQAFPGTTSITHPGGTPGTAPTCAINANAGSTATCTSVVGSAAVFKFLITPSGTGGADGTWATFTFGSPWKNKPICILNSATDNGVGRTKAYEWYSDYAGSSTTTWKMGLTYGTDVSPGATTFVAHCADPGA